MKKNKAIELLRDQKGKLLDKNYYKGDNWVNQTASYVRDIFGEHSPEYNSIVRFSFTVVGLSSMSSEEWHYEIDQKKVEAGQYIDHCIETVMKKGVFRQDKNNFLSRLNDNSLTAIIIAVISGIATLAFIAGNYTSDVKNIELRQELKAARDSIKTFIVH